MTGQLGHVSFLASQIFDEPLLKLLKQGPMNQNWHYIFPEIIKVCCLTNESENIFNFATGSV